ncbi:outer membrane beta-barrel protein, partial [Brucella intermedia]|uniref:outer membrane beta-barrel protein n=1 Tax=Brucella intermedia TaxID=94625 RepID=UPI00235EAF05
DFIESHVTGVSFVRAQMAGLELRHSLRRDLIASAGIAYTNNDYVGDGLREQDLRETLGLEYFLSREAMLSTRYTHVDFASGFA